MMSGMHHSDMHSIVLDRSVRNASADERSHNRDVLSQTIFDAFPDLPTLDNFASPMVSQTPSILSLPPPPHSPRPPFPSRLRPSPPPFSREPSSMLFLTSTTSSTSDFPTISIIDAFPDVPTLVNFGFPDHLCGTWHHNYTRMHQQIRAASKNPSSAPPPGTPPVKFLTFDGLSHCDSLGETLMGLTSAFTVALLTNRAFVIKHPCIPMAFEPALIDWQPTEDVGFEPRPAGAYAEGREWIGVERATQGNGHQHSLFIRLLGAIPAKVSGPKPEVWYRMQPFEKQLRESGGTHGPKPEVWHRMQPFEKQLRGDKVVSIGVHVRQFGQGPARPNATVSPEELQKGMNNSVLPAFHPEELQRGMNDSVRPAFQCAEVSGRPSGGSGWAPLFPPLSPLSPPSQQHC
ncbi:unnamed protein product [Closterium sp. Naga37s-1]|nr:unnamed protein product [Closterium sp. Naga37s-1]